MVCACSARWSIRALFLSLHDYYDDHDDDDGGDDEDDEVLRSPEPLLTLAPTRQVSCTNSLEVLKERWAIYRNQCLDHLGTTPPASGNASLFNTALLIHQICSYPKVVPS